jgi:hypothetical protein
MHYRILTCAPSCFSLSHTCDTYLSSWALALPMHPLLTSCTSSHPFSPHAHDLLTHTHSSHAPYLPIFTLMHPTTLALGSAPSSLYIGEVSSLLKVGSFATTYILSLLFFYTLASISLCGDSHCTGFCACFLWCNKPFGKTLIKNFFACTKILILGSIVI